MLTHELQYGASKSTFNTAIFHCNDLWILIADLMEHFLIQRLYKTHIIMTGSNTLALQITNSCGSKITRMTQGENSYILSFSQFTAFTNRNLFHLSLPFRHHTLTSWIADGYGRLHFIQLCSIHEIA